MAPGFAHVAVLVPIPRTFTYRVPEALAHVAAGARVFVQFGKQKTLGVVVGLTADAPEGDIDLKPITHLVDDVPILPVELLDFLRELAAYYLAPIGEVVRLALPALERRESEQIELKGLLESDEKVRRVRHVGEKTETIATAITGAVAPEKLRGQSVEVLAHLKEHGPTSITALTETFKNARAAVKKLETLALVTVEKRAKLAPLDATAIEPRDAAPELTEPQRAACARIGDALAQPDGPGAAFLLQGVTGSGKTEVYLDAIERTLALGRGALCMVPEIALTPQLVSRFRARLGDALAVIHSGLNDKERHTMWKRLARREVRVAVGARSALFAPVGDLGLVVVDEEHDSSFKQEEGVRYHARDMALLRAHRARAVCILGSATPSLESVALASRGRLELLRLPERANRAATLPTVEIVDLRRIGAGPIGHKLISLPLHRALEKVLERGEQAILFLNRRGFSPTLVCGACGAFESCPACSVSLTYHRLRGPGRVRCHYCGYDAPLPERCSACKVPDLSQEGLGTEQLEETIAAGLPGARVARLDRDTATGTSVERILSRVRKGEVDILVGTQMVTKGHDLPRVTLVGVINADTALSMPDFRASERTFQLLVQVAGRAGRHEAPGKVLIQTRAPDHPALQFARTHDVDGFLRAELEDRERVGYPPFARLALVRIDSLDERIAVREAGNVAKFARESQAVARGDVEVLGPAPAPIARLRARYRYRVLLRSKERPPLRHLLDELSIAIRDADRRARVVLDVDPVGMM